MNPQLMKAALRAQRTEISEYHVYQRLAELSKDEGNARVLRSIGDMEREHSEFWKTRTGRTVKPDWWHVNWQVFLARLLGLTFVLKLMEKREGTGSKLYDILGEHFPEAKQISADEAQHEKDLLAMLDEERLQYVGSIVLGLNDALVELTGALAGFTLALGNNRLIALAGLVTGISAAFSMAASDFLASRAEGNPRAAKSAIYTGVAYFITVILMVLPFLLLSVPLISLGITLAVVILIIFLFNYYISVAKDYPFGKRFLEMALISLGVAAFSFGLSFALKHLLGIDT